MTRAHDSRHSLVRELFAPGAPHPAVPGRTTLSLIALSRRLSARDYVLASLLVDHRVLTTDQITAILFCAKRTCINRLGVLRRLAFVDRFRPVGAAPGTPWHWVAGPLAVRYVALARDQRPPTARMLGQLQDAAMVSPQLAHTVGTNQFFVDLIARSRTDPQARLTRWWSATMTAAAFARRIHPDGHGVWRATEREVGWFLEHDTGSENHTRLIGKLDAYRRLRADGGPDYPVLFWLPGRQRETNLHRHLSAALRGGLTVATAARDALDGAGPADAVWRLAGNGRHRYVLADLPGGHGAPGPYAPGPPVPRDDPLYLLSERVIASADPL